MAIYDKLQNAMANRDFDAYMDLVHDEAVFIFHKSGKEFSKSEWGDMAAGMIANEKFVQDSSRCIYEHDDILVIHDFMSYPDDSKEAAMGVMMKKDNKIIRMETGATSLG